MSSMLRDRRGQMHTIEAIAAAFIMVFALAVVVQTTSLTPLSSSFTNQHIKLELQNLGNDILLALDETPMISGATGINETVIDAPSALKKSIIDWAVYSYYDTYTWNGSAFVSQYKSGVSELKTPLSNSLVFALTNNSIAYNLEVSYTDTSGYVRTSKMIWNGDPSENSATVSRFVVLHNGNNEIPVSTRYDEFIILPDIGEGTSLHNIVCIRLTLWVM